jgi:hypothetical protein
MTDLAVNPLAPAGRLTVAPNEEIASAWGNTVFDQSINQFASTADRDAQWPAPPDGALCYTAAETTLWLRRAGVWQTMIVTIPAPPRYGMRTPAAAVTSPSTANTAQKVPLAASVYDQAAALAGGTYTCPVAGRYLARGSVSASIAAALIISARVNRNGAVDTIGQAQNGTGANAATMAQAVALIMCAAGDTLELWWQVGAASIPIRATASESYLAVDYLGPT